MKKIYTHCVLSFSILLLTSLSSMAQGLNITLTSTNSTCPGTCNGTASATVSGGNAPYTYSWTPTGGTAANASGLCAGTYTLKATDVSGLTSSKTVTISTPAAINESFTISNVSCNGLTDGSIYCSTSGGTGPYTYSWSPNSGTTQTASSLAPGTYTLYVTDSHTCLASQSGTVTQPAVLAVSATHTNESCYGSTNGTATVTATGGNSSYTYSWSPSGGSSPFASALAVGTYTCHVNDSRLCATTSVVTIAQPVQLTATFTQTNSTCYMSSNGTATVTPAGGTTPYSYSWNPNGGTGATAVNMTSGSYTCFVTDANGCNIPVNLAMSQPSPLSSYVSTTTPVQCYGNSTGTAATQVSGGTLPYSYSWSPTGGTGATGTAMAAGNYTCTIKDSHSCVTTCTTSISQTPAIVVTPSPTQANCGTANGSVSVSVSGGSTPYTYSWAPPLNSTASSVSSLGAGTYSVTVTDSYGCTKTTPVTITNIGAPTLNITTVNNTCNGQANGSATVTASGGTPAYTYSWSPSGITTATANGLSAGNYNVTVKDASGCVASASATLVDPAALTGTITSVNATCNGMANGTASISATGGTGAYVYSWSPTTGTTQTISSLMAGNYTCVTTDAKGCTYMATTVITQPAAIAPNFTSTNPSCNGNSNGSATANVSGGKPSYAYSWSPTGATTPSISGLSAGSYILSVTDGNGCIGSFPVTLTDPALLIGSVATNNIVCYGSCNGSASTTISGGTGAYTYSWNTGANSATVLNICAGTYTCTIKDANNCKYQVAATITQPASAVTNALTALSSSCGGACDGAITSSASGGSAPYQYSWTPGGQTTASTTKLCAGTYTCITTDSKGCIDSSTAVIGSKPSPTIRGTVKASISGAISFGWAYLVQYDVVLKRQHVIDSTAIVSGKYTFTNSIGGPLLVYAEANRTLYPNTAKTYSLHATQWDSATVINAACGSVDTANINMYEFSPLTGSGSLGGVIVKGLGYTGRVEYGPNPGVLVPGEPIPGLDVNLEQHPGGIIFHTTTDSTGTYHFGKVPAGTYRVFVDIPGLGMTSQYTRTIASNQMYTNLNYRVDSAHIRPDSTIASGIIQHSAVSPVLNVAPNPFKDELRLSYTLGEASDVTFEVFNLLGERVALITKTRQDAGTHEYLLNSAENKLSQGTYLLKMTSKNGSSACKIVCMP